MHMCNDFLYMELMAVWLYMHMCNAFLYMERIESCACERRIIYFNTWKHILFSLKTFGGSPCTASKWYVHVVPVWLTIFFPLSVYHIFPKNYENSFFDLLVIPLVCVLMVLLVTVSEAIAEK
jgi:hypothetical protein